MTAPLDSFEDALLAQLRDHASQHHVVARRTRRRRFVLLSVATLATAAAIVVIVPGIGPTSAYSVVEGNSGTITVEVRRFEDAEGLEAKLADYDVKADVTYVPQNQECAPGRYTPVKRSLSGMGITVGKDLLRVTLPPGTVRQGETFVLAVSGSVIPAPSGPASEDGVTTGEGFRSWSDFDVTAGPVRPCQVVPSTSP